MALPAAGGRRESGISVAYNFIRGTYDCPVLKVREGVMEKVMERVVEDRTYTRSRERQVIWYEDDFTRFVKENWEELGLTPVFLKLLVESLGWWAELVEECFESLVGKDYADIEMTEWIERLTQKGYEFPDGKPVIKILNDILIEVWSGEANDLIPLCMNGLRH